LPKTTNFNNREKREITMQQKVFMIMDFSDETANSAYEHCIKKVCSEFDLEIRRADEVFTTNPVYDDILNEIREASVIIADISTRNPNVYYELGISHLLKQSQTIMITHGNYEELPFDISHFRILHYDDTIEGSRSFETQLKRTLENLLKNYKEIFKDEFELIAKVLVSNNRTVDVIAIIGLEKSTQIVRTNQTLFFEGTNALGLPSAAGTISDDEFQQFVDLDFVSKSSNQFILTEKGRAFVSYLMDKGYDCHVFNEEILTEGYKPKLSKMAGDQPISEKELVDFAQSFPAP